MKLVDAAQIFFGKVQEIGAAVPILQRLEGQKFQFIFKDDEPFNIEVSKGRVTAKAGRRSETTDEWVSTFRTDRETMKRILNGTLRFADSLAPIGANVMVLEDNFLIKYHIISLLGQLVRLRQESLGKGAEAPTNVS